MPTNIHPAIAEELEMLRARFPGKEELTLDDYADYFGVSRHYASQHFNRQNKDPNKINHKRIGRRVIIPLLDFAYWLAQKKVVDGLPLILPTAEENREWAKRQRGFCKKTPPAYSYRRVG